jgi:DNA-binding MarR family transcriptional regulator
MKYTDCIVFLLAKAHRKALNNLKKRLQPFGLTPVQHLILEIVWEYEGLTAGEVGKKMISDNATVSDVLDRMEEAGLIVKKADPNDKRIVRIYLSEKTKKQESTFITERQKTNEDILHNFSIEERLLLKRLLRDLQ